MAAISIELDPTTLSYQTLAFEFLKTGAKAIIDTQKVATDFGKAF